MSGRDQNTYLKRLFHMAADTCDAAGLDGPSRHLRQAKIVRGNLFQCANRAYMAVELNVRMNFGRLHSNPHSVAARAVESMSMLRVAMDHLIASPLLEWDWLEAIEMRMELLRTQACSNPVSSSAPSSSSTR